MWKLNEILSGWANVIIDKFNALDPSIKLQAEERFVLCNACHMREGNVCSTNKIGMHIETLEEKSGCGCFLSAKVLSPESECPLGLWKKMENKT